MANIEAIREWLGAGAINLFGLPMSGKDTQGERLAAALSAQLLSAGALVRSSGVGAQDANAGKLVATDVFQGVILPNLIAAAKPDKPLILSSVGRWHGEEEPLLERLQASDHPLRAVIYLELDEEQAWQRWREAQAHGRITEAAEKSAAQERRADDVSEEIFARRLAEFREKTWPVLDFYANRGLLLKVDGLGAREEIFERILQALEQKAIA